MSNDPLARLPGHAQLVSPLSRTIATAPPPPRPLRRRCRPECTQRLAHKRLNFTPQRAQRPSAHRLFRCLKCRRGRRGARVWFFSFSTSSLSMMFRSSTFSYPMSGHHTLGQVSALTSRRRAIRTLADSIARQQRNRVEITFGAALVCDLVDGAKLRAGK